MCHDPLEGDQFQSLRKPCLVSCGGIPELERLTASLNRIMLSQENLVVDEGMGPPNSSRSMTRRHAQQKETGPTLLM